MIGIAVVFFIHNCKSNKKYLVVELEKNEEWCGKIREQKTESNLSYPAVKPVLINDVSSCKNNLYL